MNDWFLFPTEKEQYIFENSEGEQIVLSKKIYEVSKAYKIERTCCYICMIDEGCEPFRVAEYENESLGINFVSRMFYNENSIINKTDLAININFINSFFFYIENKNSIINRYKETDVKIVPSKNVSGKTFKNIVEITPNKKTTITKVYLQKNTGLLAFSYQGKVWFQY